MKKNTKRIFVLFMSFMILFGYIVKPVKINASNEKVDVKIETSEKEVYEGVVIEFGFSYTVKSPSEIKAGDKVTIVLPEIFKKISPDYPKEHFSDMEINDGVVTLTFKEFAQNGENKVPVKGYISLALIAGQIQETKAYPITINMLGDTTTYQVNGHAREESNGLGEAGTTSNYPKLMKDSTLAPNSSGEYIITDINEPVGYRLIVNYDKEELKNVQVSDELPDGMELIEDSIVVEKYSRDSSDYGGKSPDITKSLKGFSINFGDINEGYQVTYKAKITSIQAKYSNKGIIKYDDKSEDAIANAKIKKGAGALSVEKVVDKSVIDSEDNQIVKYRVLFSTSGQFGENSINFQDDIYSKAKVVSVSSSPHFTVKVEENKISAINDKKALIKDEECFIEIVTDMSSVDYGEIVTNSALVNGTKTNIVSTKKAYVVDILKHDSHDESLLLQGAKFEVKDSKGMVIKEVTTNDLGRATFTLMDSGEYTLKEVMPPKGYELLKDEIAFTVEAQSSTIKVLDIPNTKSEAKPPVPEEPKESTVPTPVPEEPKESKEPTVPTPVPEKPKEPTVPTPVPEESKKPTVPTPVPEKPKEPTVPIPVPEESKEPTVPTPVPEEPKESTVPTPVPEESKKPTVPTPVPEKPNGPTAPTSVPEEPKESTASTQITDKNLNESTQTNMETNKTSKDLPVTVEKNKEISNENTATNKLPQTGSLFNTEKVQFIGIVFVIIGVILVKRK